jgi:hypothetical protein
MGAGVAKRIDEMYPEACAEYRRRCWQRDYVPGNLIEEYTAVPGLKILHFPTKVDWKNPSLIEYIDAGFEGMIRKYGACQTEVRFNMPALGCGLGGLDFADVKDLAKQYFENASFTVNLFPPKGQ